MKNSSHKDAQFRALFVVYKKSAVLDYCTARTFQQSPRKRRSRVSAKSAFSLIEMLMALLVASLLMAALAPVMIKKNPERLQISEGRHGVVLNYGDSNCLAVDAATLNNGNASCSGEFIVPADVKSITVTLLAAGGGGGGGNTTGFSEYKSAGNFSFEVPIASSQLESTLVSGGAGGAAGAQVQQNQTYTVAGEYNWGIPAAVRGENVIVEACGGGGGGGGGPADRPTGTEDTAFSIGSGGGTGAAVRAMRTLPAALTTVSILIGGGGGGGGNGMRQGAANGFGGATSGWHTGGGGLLNCASGGRVGGGGCNGVNANGGTGPGGAGGNGYTHIVAGMATRYTGGGAGGTWEGGTGGTGGFHMCGSPGNGGGGGGATLFGETEILNGNGVGPAWTVQAGGGGGGASGEVAPSSPGCLGQAQPLMSAGGGGGGNGGGRGGNVTGGDRWGTIADREVPESGRGGIPGGVNGATAARGGPSNGLPALGGALTNFGQAGVFANSCNGGNGAGLHTPTTAPSGRQGALNIIYLFPGNGGSGGGSGSVATNINSVNKIVVTPKETLALTVGVGGTGGVGGSITGVGAFQDPTNGTCSGRTILSRGATGLMNSLGGCSSGNVSGSTSGAVLCGSPFHGLGGMLNSTHPGCASITNTDALLPDFSTTYGRTAGDVAQFSNGPFANGTIGGRGGVVKTPWYTCTAGSGGTSPTLNGGAASTWGGCGGGGGYGLGDGGAGSAGYARLTYNPNKLGFGGGGASGYIVKKVVIPVTPGMRIPYKIGAGGIGGGDIDTINNLIKSGRQGGETRIGTGSTLAVAGGGFGGTSPSVSGVNTLNGTGGAKSNTCIVSNSNSTLCKDSKIGENPTATSGGKGASPVPLVDIKGGIVGTLAQAMGIASHLLGAGGGGAAVYENLTSGDAPAYPKGGQGGNGQIIIEW